MSDFLSNLMARSFADASAIQPRLPSRFEAGGAGTFSENQISEESSTVSAGQKTFNSPMPNPEKAKNFSAPKFEPANKKVLPVTNGKAAEPLPPESFLEAGKIQPSKKVLPVTNGKAAEPLPPESFLEAGKIQPSDLSASAERITQAAVTPMIRPASKSPDEYHFSEPPPGIRQRITAAHFEPKSAQTTPTINVTIGRVEVRAIHQSSPSSKAAKSVAPKLSLDDYLQKRDGGAR